VEISGTFSLEISTQKNNLFERKTGGIFWVVLGSFRMSFVGTPLKISHRPVNMMVSNKKSILFQGLIFR